MKLEELSLKEQLVLCRRAKRQCARHFRVFSEALRAVDPPLAEQMGTMAGEEEAHATSLDHLDRSADWPVLWTLTEPHVERLIRKHFPSLVPEYDALAATPEAALSFAEGIERESARLYRALAEKTTMPRAAAVFRTLARSEQRHLEAVSRGS